MRHTSLRLLLGVVLLAGAAACQTEPEPPGNAVPGGAGTSSIAVGGSGGMEDGAGGGGGGILPCDAWEGPFGTHQQETLDPTRSWSGFLPGKVDPGIVSLEDYAACGEGDDVKAIVIYIDALWCPVCRDVAGELADKYASDWKARGIRVITLVIEDQDSRPADVEAAWVWRDQFGLQDLAVAYDPQFSLANGDPNDLPQALIVDPVTMRIVERNIGKIDLDPSLDAFLEGRSE